MTVKPPKRLSDMRNLGPVTEERLVAVGTADPAELERVGAFEAFCRLRDAFSGWATLVLVYALEGALLDERWDRLSPQVRERLGSLAGARPRS